MNSLEKTVRELMYIQVPCEQVVSFIKQIYVKEEGGNND